MGSAFSTYTLKEAAAILKRSQRSIRLYTKNGLIRKVTSPHKGLTLVKEDVDQLAMERESGLKPVNRQTIIELNNKVRKLEEDMTIVRRLLDLDLEPLHVSRSFAHDLLSEANLAVNKVKEFGKAEERLWVNVCSRLDIAGMDVMAKELNDLTPWKPFYLIISELSIKYGLKDLEIEDSRRRLRAQIILWVELGKGPMPKGLYRPLDPLKGGILGRLGANRGK